MKKQLIECVPNFSEGNDMNIINQITAAMKTVEGISVIAVSYTHLPLINVNLRVSAKVKKNGYYGSFQWDGNN